MAESSIEWTEHTWNPTTGCTKVSPGCKNCYAEKMAARLLAMGATGYELGFKLTLHPDRLSQPLRRSRPTVYFVNSMSDLFHEDVPDRFIAEVLAICRATPRHTYQILTKRADRLSRSALGQPDAARRIGFNRHDARHRLAVAGNHDLALRP